MQTGWKTQNVPARPPGACPARGPPSVPPPAPRGARRSSVGPNDDQDVRCAAHDGARASCHPMPRMLGENVRAARLVHGVVPNFVCPAGRPPPAGRRPGPPPGPPTDPGLVERGPPLDVVRPQMLAPAHPRTLQPYRGPPRRPAPRRAAHMPVHGPPSCGARPAGRPGALPGGARSAPVGGLCPRTFPPRTQHRATEIATTFHQR